MKVVRALHEIGREKNTVVTVGTFDGVHLAHQEIIREVVNRTRVREGRSVVVTFEPHPKQVVASSKGPIRLLSTMDERIARFGELHIDLLWIISFTYEFSRQSPREFYENYVVRGSGVSEVVVGYDHMFGRDREAGIEELVKMGKEFDFSVFAVHPFTIDGTPVSSTRIRKALEEGNVEAANALLGYPYAVRGTVVHGDGRGGATFGYPTANLQLQRDDKVVPGRGVYVVGVRVGERRLHGMMNIGFRPTVAEGGALTLEAHLFDFSGDLYGRTLEVSFLHRLREEKKFGSLQELIVQLDKDREESLRLIAARVRQQ
jgi:riboflavin kinase/FMN adenylyltransferase